jgi:hypothetical protein
VLAGAVGGDGDDHQRQRGEQRATEGHSPSRIPRSGP